MNKWLFSLAPYPRQSQTRPLLQLRARKEIFLLLARMHNYLGGPTPRDGRRESDVAVSLADHARCLAVESSCERTNIQANKRLFFANYSRAGYNGYKGDSTDAETTQLEMSAVQSHQRSSKVANSVGIGLSDNFFFSATLLPLEPSLLELRLSTHAT